MKAAILITWAGDVPSAQVWPKSEAQSAVVAFKAIRDAGGTAELYLNGVADKRCRGATVSTPKKNATR